MSGDFENKRGRINLNFNLEDPDSKAVYEYLLSMKTLKTQTVVNAVMRTQLSGVFWENYVAERNTALAEKIIENIEEMSGQSLESRVGQQLNTIFEKLSNIEDKLDNVTVPVVTQSSEPSVSDTQQQEIADDAFSAISSMTTW